MTHCIPFHNQSMRAMCASSCASNASTCSRGSCVSSDSGNQITGRNNFAVNGPTTSLDSRTATVRVMRSWPRSASTRACQSAGSTWNGCFSSVPSNRQPPKRRSSIAPTPHSQIRASTAATGLDCCTNAPVAASSSGAVIAGSQPSLMRNAGCCEMRTKVMAGTPTIASRKPIAVVCRSAAVARDSAANASQAPTASSVTCHTECNSAAASAGAKLHCMSASVSISLCASPWPARSTCRSHPGPRRSPRCHPAHAARVSALIRRTHDASGP